MTTRATVPADGTTSTFSIPFNYLDRTHVKVMVDGVAVESTAFSFVTEGTIQLASTPAAGADVTIYRETPSVPLTTYQSGSVLTRDQLEVDSLQALYRTEEAEELALRLPADTSAATLLPALVPLASLVVNADGTGFEMGSSEISGDLLLRGHLADADEGGASLVSVKRSGTGTVSRTLSSKLGDLALTPADFGAAADGASDDTTAVNAAIAEAISSGRTVDFGDETRAYRVTAKIQHTVGAAGLRIRSEGATITYDPASPTREAVLLLTAGNNVEMIGKLTIDANDKSYIGVLVQNDLDGSLPEHFGDFVADDLAVRNVYRSGTSFSGGDGIYVNGPFNRVILNRPDVRNCHMAVGAGLGGSQGIFGITVTRKTSVGARYCAIIDPYIDGVFSEDPGYIVDQDAIRIFGDAPGTVSSLNFFEVRGGYIGGHHGRGIKGQFNFGRVSGVKFHRYRGYTGGICGREIDFQYGGGTIRDIECLYENNFVPESIAQLADTTVAGATTPAVLVDGVKVIIDGSTVMPYAFVQAKDQDEVSHLTIANVDIRGPINRLVQWWVRGLECTLTLENIRAAPATALIYTRTTTLSTITSSRVYARNIVNTAGTTIEFLQRADPSYNRCEISANDCYGFTDDKVHFGAGASFSAPYQRVHGIAAANARDSGVFRPVSNMGLANLGEWLLPSTSQNGQGGIVIVTVGSGTNTDQAIFATSASGVLKIAGGTNWTVGTTADPGSGNWRIWGTTDNIVIKNASGATRRVMAYMFG